MPAEEQVKLINSIPGLEKTEVIRPGKYLIFHIGQPYCYLHNLRRYRNVFFH